MIKEDEVNREDERVVGEGGNKRDAPASMMGVKEDLKERQKWAELEEKNNKLPPERIPPQESKPR